MGLFDKIESAIEKYIPALSRKTELHTKIKTKEPEIQQEETSYQPELPQRKCESTVNTINYFHRAFDRQGSIFY